MKVLMVVHTALFPVDSGAVRRNLHLLLSAAVRHKVSLLILAPGHDADGFRGEFSGTADPVVVVNTANAGWRRVLRSIAYIASGRPGARWGGTRKIQQAIDSLCAKVQPDLIHLSTPFFRAFRYPTGVPVLADAHNVEHDNLRRVARDMGSPLHKGLSLGLALRLRAEEASCVRGCDALLATSGRDRELFLRMGTGTPVAVVPNGVDLSTFVPRGIEREPRSLVFAGMLNYAPNAEGILRFLRQCFPLLSTAVPDVRLTIVGGHPPHALRRLAGERVSVTGYVPDVRTYLERAEVCIVPLHSGGGTRLKILESIAMGTPVVSTSIGCEGLRLRDGEEVLIADSPGAFVRAILRLFRDPALRADLAARALDTVSGLYSWESAGEKLLDVYDSLQPLKGIRHRVRMESPRHTERQGA